MNRWVLGARPRTLPAAIVPVLVGTTAAGRPFSLSRAVLALVVSLSLQVGVNYANDYADGVRGTDHNRVGPTRLVASGLATPAAVRWAAVVAFAVAAIAGTLLAVAVNPWLVLVGAIAITAAWTYTGGPRPYGYRGLGEISVFVFFGVVGTLGSAYVQHGDFPVVAVAACVPVGALAVALLVINNLRDIPGDEASGKRTLAVRLGDANTRLLYESCIAVSVASVLLIGVLRPAAFLALVATPFAIAPLRRVRAGAAGGALIPVLGETGRFQLVFGALLALALGATATIAAR